VRQGQRRYRDWKIREEHREAFPFPYWLYQRLQERGWNALRLSTEIGVVPSLVSRWMSATQKPRPESLQAIAQAMQLSEQEVYQAAGYLSTEEAVDDPRKLELIRKIEALELTPERYATMNALLGAWNLT
jgi:transcriptional regulator with XRE-family HTH domain